MIKRPNGDARALEFTARLEPRGPKGAWVFLRLTPEQSAWLGRRGRVSVAGTLNGFSFRTSLAPDGNGGHFMTVNKAMQEGARAAAGDLVKVALRSDGAPRAVELPDDLQEALEESPEAREFFDGLSFTHRKDYVTWIVSAKREETRIKRVAETLALLEAGVRWQER